MMHALENGSPNVRQPHIVIVVPEKQARYLAGAIDALQAHATRRGATDGPNDLLAELVGLLYNASPYEQF